MAILVDLETYGLIVLITIIVFVIALLFTKTSKKDNREWWEKHRPDEPLPEKYKFDPNDPDDEKPKMGTTSKIIFGVMVLVIVIISIIIFSFLY